MSTPVSPFTPVAEIDIDALRHNLEVARRAAPASLIMAVVKANGYGHGMERVAAALDGADALAVARVEEGIRLRDAGMQAPLAVLGGPRDEAELEVAAAAGLEIVIHHQQQIELLRAMDRRGQKVRYWLKVDTGMHRLGLAPEAVVDAHASIAQAHEDGVVCAGLMTHLANADDVADPFTDTQIARLAPLRERLGLPVSIANSAGVLAWPAAHADWNRPGLMLYGASPFVEMAPLEQLKPVMTLRARLVAVRRLRRGEPIGYGGRWICPEDMSVGVVGIGYGDGYPREVPNGTPALLNGREVPLIGRVSMDMLTLDLRTQADAQIGDDVVLWGRGLPVERIAQAAGTIPYTLFCGVTGRVRFVEREGDTKTGEMA